MCSRSVCFVLAFFEVRGSIHSAVDEGLRDRVADIRELLERQWPAEQVKRELDCGFQRSRRG